MLVLVDRHPTNAESHVMLCGRVAVSCDAVVAKEAHAAAAPEQPPMAAVATLSDAMATRVCIATANACTD